MFTRSGCARLDLVGAMTRRSVDDYRVAAFPSVRGRHTSRIPETKQHAFLDGDLVTVCGFGLSEMERFSQLRFMASPATVRCSMCDRIVRAAAR